MTEITPSERVWQGIQHNQTNRMLGYFLYRNPTRIKLENYFGPVNLDKALYQNKDKSSTRAWPPVVETGSGFFRDQFGVVWNQIVDKYIRPDEEFLLRDRSFKGIKFPKFHYYVADVF
jgi:hypothetical protein